jgi:hypothetical protein
MVEMERWTLHLYNKHWTTDAPVFIPAVVIGHRINPLTTELNPSAQRCPMIFFTGDFAT